jgi:septum formation protein
MQLVLASSSRYRRELLARLGLPFTTHVPDIDESPLANEGAPALVARLARRKAEAVAAVKADALVIGSDQVAVAGGALLNKPGSERAAIAQLTAMAGSTATFYTGLCVVNSRSGAVHTAVETADVTLRALSAAEIADYVAREQPLDSAGSFKSEGLGIALFARVRSDDPTTLIGLPLIRVIEFLALEGMPVLGHTVTR